MCYLDDIAIPVGPTQVDVFAGSTTISDLSCGRYRVGGQTRSGCDGAGGCEKNSRRERKRSAERSSGREAKLAERLPKTGLTGRSRIDCSERPILIKCDIMEFFMNITDGNILRRMTVRYIMKRLCPFYGNSGYSLKIIYKIILFYH